MRGSPWPRVWREAELKRTYDAVVVGGGVHGLATAYYLARNHGITDVAVLDKAYLGGGGSGRNTAIIRSNYLTPAGVAFCDRSLGQYLFDVLIDAGAEFAITVATACTGARRNDWGRDRSECLQ